MTEWSSLQQAIFRAGEETDRSIAVVARAGTGKTTTMVELARRLPCNGQMGIVAFANRSREKIEDSKPPKEFSVKTCHALGLSLLRKHNPYVAVDNEGAKMRGIIERELRGAPPDVVDAVTTLVHKAKTRCVDDARTLHALLVESGNAIGQDSRLLVEMTQKVLFVCLEQDDIADFDDMVWLPVMLGLESSSFGTLMVDELQDLTLAQVRLVTALSKGGRTIGFGDPAQAIYMFAGADKDAVSALRDATNAIELPLSISYRCPQLVVQEAQTLVPDIEAHPSAPLGTVGRGEGSSYVHRHAKPGDLVLSRSNAPLFKLAIEFAQRSAPAEIIGRRLDKEMLGTIDRSRASTTTSFMQWVHNWAETEKQRLRLDGLPDHHVVDRVAGFAVLCDGARSLDDVRQRVIRLFMRQGKPAVHLSTVHQMKGEEANNVFVLRNTFRVKEENPRLGSEEANLLYVAITRAKRELHYVEGVK